MDSIHSSLQSSVSQNSISCDVVDESSVPPVSSLNALTKEIDAYEKESDETQDVKNALRNPESFVTHSNFDTPSGTVYYIPKVSAYVLLVKGTLYDSVDDLHCCVYEGSYLLVHGLAFGKASTIVVTNQDGAMRNAIEAEFAGSKHRLCMWHITQKLHAKFEYRWGKLMEEFKLENHKWLTKMFDIRSTWILAYLIDSPLCGLMRTTSRFEKFLVEGSEVCIIKESPYVYEMTKKKKKPHSVDKGKEKAEEDDTVDLFFKKDGLYKVLRNNANVEMILQQYILRRWTKNLIPAALMNKRNKYSEKNVVVEKFANEATSIVDHCVHLLNKDERRLGAFIEKLKSLKKDVEADCPNPHSKNKTDNLEQLVGVPKPNSCSLCGGTDHNKRTCPQWFEGQDEVVFQKEVGQEEVLVKKEVCQEEVVQEKVDLAEDEEELSEEDEDLIHE
ncbi:protein FAR1-related sequence 5 [Tanacetum coccineum]